MQSLKFNFDDYMKYKGLDYTYSKEFDGKVFNTFAEVLEYYKSNKGAKLTDITISLKVKNGCQAWVISRYPLMDLLGKSQNELEILNENYKNIHFEYAFYKIEGINSPNSGKEDDMREFDLREMQIYDDLYGTNRYEGLKKYYDTGKWDDESRKLYNTVKKG